MSLKMIPPDGEKGELLADEPHPDYNDWSQLVALIKRATEADQHMMLLTMLMTSDERAALVARINILNELLKGELSQRQISQMLGVGIATITRGSNELKNQSQQQRGALADLLSPGSDDNV